MAGRAQLSDPFRAKNRPNRSFMLDDEQFASLSVAMRRTLAIGDDRSRMLSTAFSLGADSSGCLPPPLERN